MNNKQPIGVIGGSGLTSIKELEVRGQRIVRTPFGEPSAPAVEGTLDGEDIIFLARHGQGHTIPPHRVNYRANVFALAELGVKSIISVAAVGGIGYDFTSGAVVIPDQIIDYTHCREQTYFDGVTDAVTHVDFTKPYTESMRQVFIKHANVLGIKTTAHGTYAATQGPRFETAAEIDRIDHDGGNIVGMTGMPEAVLARELNLNYATIALVVNPAAGRSKNVISVEEIMDELERGMAVVRQLLVACVADIARVE